MKRVLVVYNPVSGQKGWKDVPTLIRRSLDKAGFEVEWFETQKCRPQALKPFAGKRFFRVIVVGGDGTVAEVAAFLMKHKMKLPMVVIPQGSANLLARTLGISLLSVKRALKQGLEKPGKPVDVMQVNGRGCGLIAVGRGYDVFLMQVTKRALKRKLGLWAYVWMFLKTALFYRAQTYKITVDGKRHSFHAKSVMIFNMLPFAGFMIKPNDGVLDAFVLTAGHELHRLRGKRIVVKAKKERRFEVDGDVFKSRTVTVEVLPKALKIVH